MSHIKDLTGKRFGRLVVIKRDGKVKNGNITWLCQCDCGRMKVVDGYCLRSGQTLSCGCLRRDHAKQAIRKNPETMKYMGNWHVLEKTWHPTSQDLRANNKSGITGVSYDQKQNKWVARLYFHGKYVLNSMYDRKENAIVARKNAEAVYLEC